VGCEGFFCLFRNTLEISFEPYWFFTRPEFEDYTATVVNKIPNWTARLAAAKLEAFSIAGCDLSGTFSFTLVLFLLLIVSLALCLNSRDRAKALKAEIRNSIKEKLSEFSIHCTQTVFINLFVVKATGNQKIKMNYTHFYETFVVQHKINIVGWPTTVRFINPSELSDSLPPLLELRDSLIEGSCYFKKLSDREVKDLTDKWKKGVEAGEIEPMQRKVRKDKKTDVTHQAKKTPAAKKRAVKKSAEIIDSDSDDSGDGSAGDESESDNEEEAMMDNAAPSPAVATLPTCRSSHRGIATTTSSINISDAAETPSAVMLPATTSTPSVAENPSTATAPVTETPGASGASSCGGRSPLGDITASANVGPLSAPPSLPLSSSEVSLSGLPAKRAICAPIRYGWDEAADERPAKKRKSSKKN
jgi:hypothetical protein